jgi:hypothetical protein
VAREKVNSPLSTGYPTKRGERQEGTEESSCGKEKLRLKERIIRRNDDYGNSRIRNMRKVKLTPNGILQRAGPKCAVLIDGKRNEKDMVHRLMTG